RTVVKVPLTESAIRQVPDLKARGCPILMTACYSSKQMVVAAALGADYIAPYYGRMDEAGLDAFGTMSRIMHVAKLPDVRTRVLVASLRRVEQLNELAALGCDCFTLSPELATALLSDEHSDRATAEFERAAGN
ncbi:MAG: transaldolase family protein, partial [Pseudomonadota bacterium]